MIYSTKSTTFVYAPHSSFVNGVFNVDFVVQCTRILPMADREYSPKLLEKIHTRVISGWVG